jgi:hypothetical protein
MSLDFKCGIKIFEKRWRLIIFWRVSGYENKL